MNSFLKNSLALLSCLLLLLAGCVTICNGPAPEPAAKPELSPEEKQAAAISKQIEAMSLEEKVSQLFFVTPEALTSAWPVTEVNEELQTALQETPPGGIILFASNITGEDQLKAFLKDMKQTAKTPLLTGIDEEGGPLVARIANSGLIDVPAVSSMYEIGQTGDPANAAAAGKTIGTYLHELGFSLDFAPDADVLVDPNNVEIGSRSFGEDPQLVAQMAWAYAEALEKEGVLPCYKHFPGLGATSGTDSHYGTEIIERTEEQMKQSEWVPFEKGIQEGVPFIMVGHLSVPQLTGNNVPASLSKTVISDILRDQLGFKGVVITDSLQMGAIVDNYGDEAALQAFESGADLLLMPQNLEASRQAILEAVQNGELEESRIDESLQRIFKAKAEAGLLSFS